MGHTSTPERRAFDHVSAYSRQVRVRARCARIGASPPSFFRMCLAHLNQDQQSHFLKSRGASSSQLISSNCGYRYCFSTCYNLVVGVNSVTKISIMQSIHGELNTYVFSYNRSSYIQDDVCNQHRCSYNN
jgi:hypothetical protein